MTRDPVTGAYPIIKDANGNLVAPPGEPGTGQQYDGHGVPIPTPTP